MDFFKKNIAIIQMHFIDYLSYCYFHHKKYKIQPQCARGNLISIYFNLAVLILSSFMLEIVIFKIHCQKSYIDAFFTAPRDDERARSGKHTRHFLLLQVLRCRLCMHTIIIIITIIVMPLKSVHK